jgi:hypothetical protein
MAYPAALLSGFVVIADDALLAPAALLQRPTSWPRGAIHPELTDRELSAAWPARRSANSKGVAALPAGTGGGLRREAGGGTGEVGIGFIHVALAVSEDSPLSGSLLI